MRKQTSSLDLTRWPFFWSILVAVILLAIPLWRIWVAMDQNRFDQLILEAAAENGCDPSLVKAVVWRESKFDPHIHGQHGELGLMQVTSSVGTEWAQAQGEKSFDSNRLLDPATNLRIGSWYLSKGFQQWTYASEPIPIVLAQYNAGRNNVLKWIDANSLANADHFLERIQFPSTRSYVHDILKQYKLYQTRGEF